MSLKRSEDAGSGALKRSRVRKADSTQNRGGLPAEQVADRYTHIVHPIPPFCRPDSRILILGSFPSVKSRESGFFYGHPQNRFWKMMAAIYEETAAPQSVPEKAAFLERHRIAAWDTIHACDIIGSSDSSIKNVEVNDLSVILDSADIGAIWANGTTSWKLYMKYCREQTGRDAQRMPSTSPANAAWSLDRLIEAWRGIRDYTG